MDSAATAYRKPLPGPDPVMKPFWEHAHAGRLAIQACNNCGDMHMPAAPVCPKCLDDDQEWQIVSGNGTLESWVEFHKAYWGGFVEDLPYVVCLVRLDEGPLMYSNIVGAKEEGLTIGQRVRVVFDRVTPEVTLPKFSLA